METLAILIIEGKGGLARALLASRPGFALIHAERMSKAAALAAPSRAAGGFAAVLVDLALPDCSGPDACRQAAAAAPGVPVVALLRDSDPAACEAAMAAGAETCLERDGLDGGALASALRQAVLRRRAEARRFRSLLDAAPIGILLAAGRRVLIANAAAMELLGCDESSLASLSVLDPFPEAARPLLEGALDAAARGEEPAAVRFTADLARRDGNPLRCRVHLAPAGLNGAPVAALFLEPREAPGAGTGNGEAARQAGKMDALTRLAGGIAHDFNNLLAVVNGYAEHLLARYGAEGPMSAGLRAIRRAGQSAADLARGMQGMLQGGEGEPSPVAVDAVLRGMDPMLRRIAGDGIALRMDLRAGGAETILEAGQLERAMANLCANAREAMPGGGILAVSTSREDVGPGQGFTHLAAAEGPAVVLAVEDTGLGMDAGILERLFEPFFTTKRGGQGAGMGLAAVYGMVARAGGGIAVESGPGTGTRIRLYLPIREAALPRGGSAAPSAAVPAASGADRLPEKGEVLVVEDESSLREMIQTILERSGFAVRAASSPGEAEEMLASGPGRVDLVVTDVMLRGESGPEMAERLQAMRPGLRALFISGHSIESLAERGIEVPPDAFLEKPFTPSRLAALARALMEASRAAG